MAPQAKRGALRNLPMSAKKSDYAKRAKLLRKYGYKVAFKTGGSPQQKSAVTRSWRKIKNYVEGSKQQFRFFAADTKKTRKIRGVLSPIQITPKGFFFRVPNGAKSYKLDLDGRDVKVIAKGMRGGIRRETYVKLNAVEVAKDPAAAVRKALKGKLRGAHRGKIVVNGNDGRNAYPIQYFLNYAPELARQLLDPERESPDDSGIARKRIATNFRPMPAQQVVDIFHLKLEYQSPSNYSKRETTRKKPTQRKKGKRK